jgi:hypothetical protein
MPLETLFAMYRTTPAAKKLFDSLARSGAEDNRTTVDELIEDGDISRSAAITVLREIEEAGYGEFKLGRKGHPSRLEWSEDPRSLAERLAGESSQQGEGEVTSHPVPSSVLADRKGVLEMFPGAEVTRRARRDRQRGADQPDDGEPEPPRRRRGRRAAAKQPDNVEHAAKPQRDDAPSDADTDAGVNAGMIEHSYILRPELRVVIQLPADLSAREAQVLGDWIRNLSFER